MKEFKGTKGNWHTVEDNRVVYVENKDQVLVAELDNHKTLGFNQATPTAVYFNAKLIAAAPDLLNALIKLLDDVENNQLHEYVDYVGLIKAVNKAL